MSIETVTRAELEMGIGLPRRFCLTNAATAAILRGCKACKAATESYLTDNCTDPVSGEESDQTIYPDS